MFKKHLYALFILLMTSASALEAATYYVRKDGGDATQCTGLADAAYPGNGTSQACAFNHPNWALAIQGNSNPSKLQGGDTLIIDGSNGAQYMLGWGSPNIVDGSCAASYAWDCHLRPVPSGPSPSQPTRILGKGYDTGCSAPPQLWGTQRVGLMLNLNGSNNVQIQCLEITDHSSCIQSGPTNACNRDTYPFGEWAGTGLRAADSSNVLIKNVNIHGLTSGVHAGRLRDWTIENTTIANNSFVGWDGDIGANASSNSGNIIFRNSKILYSGCGETYPGKQPYSCYSQDQGGYGDGIGTHRTGGNWIFENTEISHNVSDGLDLLYHDGSGTITIQRSRFEGNAGNQIKVSANSIIENSIVIGNCGYFYGQSFTWNPTGGPAFNNCRAAGGAVVFSYPVAGLQNAIYNSTIFSNGDTMVSTGGGACNGNETIIGRNNIFLGGIDFFQNWESSDLFYNAGAGGNGDGPCGTINFDNDYAIVWGTKGNATRCSSAKPNVLCSDPQLIEPTVANYQGNAYRAGLQSTSPAINRAQVISGKSPLDYNSYNRGSQWDIGALEYGSTGGGGGGSTTPTISAQPQNVSVSVGQNATFSISASGNPSPTYQWKSKASGATTFTNITGATGTSYTLTNAQTTNSGTQFQCTVTNSAGAVTSNAATLTVTGGNPVCGNSLLEGTEQCDDGNLINGDGCTSTCTRESLPPVTGTDVIENFTTPRTYTDGLQFGACNTLTAELSGSPTLSVVNNNYLLATSTAKSDAFIIRTTNPLPSTYKVTVDIGDINFDLANALDEENGFYLPTITAVPGAPTTNNWWHSNRKIHIDIDNNVWGWGGTRPVFFGYYNPSSVGAADPSAGQLVFDQATNAWVAINTNWASAFNYQKNTWYTFEIEKTATTYFFRIYNAFTDVKLKEASVPISSVRSGSDYLAIGDPHTNFYNGNVKIANLRITNMGCTVTTAPSITAQPQGLSITAGLNATFSITATGTPAPTYQWQSKLASATTFTNITGATGTSYTLTNAQTSNSGLQFRVVVTNSAGSVTSNAATLTVTAAPVAPSITTQPQGLSITAGQNATFSVTATGTPAPTYQWQFKASTSTVYTSIAGATAASYTFSNAQLSHNASQFRVLVANSSGTVTSSVATLTVTAGATLPVITGFWQRDPVYVGQDAAFSITATGNPAPTYQWQSKTPGASSFSPIAGATNFNLLWPNAQLSNNGTQVRVLVTNSSGTVTSIVATITVTVATVAPTITAQPLNVSVVAGQNANFTVTATGTPTPTYQWQSRASGATTFTNVTGATGTSYTLPNAQTSNNGSQFRVVVTNSSGAVTSNAATLTVTAPTVSPTITTQPQNLSVLTGQSVTFSVAATGTPAPTYQWQSKVAGATSFTAIPGATGTSYSFTNAQLSNNGTQFQCLVSNSVGSVASTIVTLTVTAGTVPPTITTQPQNLSVVAGQNATFSVAATGSPTPAYQWQSRSLGSSVFTGIPGATSPSYTLVNVQPAQSGMQFRVTLTNSAGSIISSAASLTILTAPTISAQPQDASTEVGQSATFSVVATGTPAPTYQWQSAASGSSSFTPIPGATGASYTTPLATDQDNGKLFRVVITNSVGNVTSNAAVWSVQSTMPAPFLSLPPILPADGSVTVSYPSGYTVTGYEWTFESQPGGFTTAGTTPRSGSAVVSKISAFSTASPQLSLGSHNLAAGYYLVSVRATGTNGRISAAAQAYVTLVAADLTNVKVFPNPWRADKHTGTSITFSNLTINSTVKIFTVSGHVVKTLPVGSSTVTWDLTTDSGEKAASGLYMYLITTGGSKVHGKFAIVK